MQAAIDTTGSAIDGPDTRILLIVISDFFLSNWLECRVRDIVFKKCVGSHQQGRDHVHTFLFIEIGQDVDDDLTPAVVARHHVVLKQEANDPAQEGKRERGGIRGRGVTFFPSFPNSNNQAQE